MSSVFQGYFPVYNTHLSCLQLSFQVFPEQCSSFVLEIRITDTKPDVNVHYYMITIVLLGVSYVPFCPFLSCLFWLVMVERDMKKVNLFGKVQADRPHL